MKKKVIAEIFDWAKYVAAALVFALIINNTVLVNAKVMSPSMESTVMTDSRVFGFRLAYRFGEPERFDIILFKFPDNETFDPFLKRIIGLPGETLEIKSGKVFINGSDVPLDDSFVNEEPLENFGPVEIPAGSYFVMGDNRNNSHDSVDWVNKFVEREKILGKVFAEYFPAPKLLS